MAKGAETWADQWGSPLAVTNEKKENQIGKKLEGVKKSVKKLASAGPVRKAKAAAVVGAKKVKVGAAKGLKFVKAQCKKRESSK